VPARWVGQGEVHRPWPGSIWLCGEGDQVDLTPQFGKLGAGHILATAWEARPAWFASFTPPYSLLLSLGASPDFSRPPNQLPNPILL